MPYYLVNDHLGELQYYGNDFTMASTHLKNSTQLWKLEHMNKEAGILLVFLCSLALF